MSAVFENAYVIPSYQLDSFRNLSPVGICQLFQEYAGRHAHLHEVGFNQLQPKAKSWMLSRIGVKINQVPKWQEKVRIHTWVRKYDRLFSYRDFEIQDENGNVLIAASTCWLVLDMASRRLSRVDQILENFEISDSRQALEEELGKVEAFEPEEFTQPFSVKFSDVDMIGHVNNVRYIDWLVNGFPLSHWEEHQLAYFEVNFIAEAAYGDEIRVGIKEGETYLAKAISMQEKKELVRSKLRFAPRI